MTYRPGITVVIPTIPPRPDKLARAVSSAMEQTRPPDAFAIEVDHTHAGAGPTRTRALQTVKTEWTAFLDDDDYWYRDHLETLLRAATVHEADLVYPWFDVIDAVGNVRPTWDPFPQFEGKPWDPDQPHLFPICALVRTRLAQKATFPRAPDGTTDPHWGGDDWPFWCQVFDLGATVYHVDKRTWAYNHWGTAKPGVPGNTSGLGSRW